MIVIEFPTTRAVVGINFTVKEPGPWPMRPFATTALVHVTAVEADVLPEFAVTGLPAPVSVVLAVMTRLVVVAEI